MFQELKYAFGDVMARYRAELSPTTPQVQEFINRELAKSIAWASGRMVDEAETMLASWQKNDTDSADSSPYRLPVILIAMDNNTIMTGADYTQPVSNPNMVIIPEDPKERMFGLRTSVTDKRLQIAVFARDPHTAMSLAAQMTTFFTKIENRRFWPSYLWAGIGNKFPAQLESTDLAWINIKNGVNNLTILAADVNLKLTVPFYDAPKPGEANDGKGSGTPDDPHGYPFIREIDDMNPMTHPALTRGPDDAESRIIAKTEP